VYAQSDGDGNVFCLFDRVCEELDVVRYRQFLNWTFVLDFILYC